MKVLIVRFSSIGDIVLTTPVVRCIKQQLPGVELHYLTKPGFKQILAPNPYIDKIYTLQDSLSVTAKVLRAEKYDFIVDLHNNQRTLALKALLRRPGRSFYKMNLEKWLMVQFKVNKLSPLHIVDRYLAAAKPLGITNDGQGLDHFILEKDVVDISVLPETHRKGYIALVIGAKHNTKKLPEHKLITLCQQLHYPIVLLGGPEDKAQGEAIAKAGTHVYNACGGFSLAGSASLVQQADLVISHDTGLMHIAAAMKKPILSVWGNTIPEFGMYPYYGEVEVTGSKMFEVKDLSCRPCSKIGYMQCPKKHFKCMEQQNIDAIVQQAMQLLTPPLLS